MVALHNMQLSLSECFDKTEGYMLLPLDRLDMDKTKFIDRLNLEGCKKACMGAEKELGWVCNSFNDNKSFTFGDKHFPPVCILQNSKMDDKGAKFIRTTLADYYQKNLQ